MSILTRFLARLRSAPVAPQAQPLPQFSALVWYTTGRVETFEASDPVYFYTEVGRLSELRSIERVTVLRHFGVPAEVQ